MCFCDFWTLSCWRRRQFPFIFGSHRSIFNVSFIGHLFAPFFAHANHSLHPTTKCARVPAALHALRPTMTTHWTTMTTCSLTRTMMLTTHPLRPPPPRLPRKRPPHHPSRHHHRHLRRRRRTSTATKTALSRTRARPRLVRRSPCSVCS